jgi:hypothetical protein
MAFEQPLGLCGILPSSGNLSTSQYLALAENSSGQVVVATSTTAPIIGVLQNDPSAAGNGASFMYAGITKMVAGSALSTPGVQLMINGSGQAIAWTSPNCAVGILLDTASGAGALCSVLLMPSAGKVA